MTRRTFADDLVDDAAKVFLNTEEFAQVVTRVAVGGSEPVNAVWWEQTSHRHLEAGEDAVRVGTLMFAGDQDVATTDQWTIGGETWQIGDHENLGTVAGNIRTIHLRRDERKFTRRQSRNIL